MNSKRYHHGSLSEFFSRTIRTALDERAELASRVQSLRVDVVAFVNKNAPFERYCLLCTYCKVPLSLLFPFFSESFGA